MRATTAVGSSSSCSPLSVSFRIVCASPSRSRKGQLKQANRIAARWTAILGDEGATLKDMETGGEEIVAPEEVIARLHRGERSL